MVDDNTEEAALRLAVSERPDRIQTRKALASFLLAHGRRLDALSTLRDALFFVIGREDRLEELAEAFIDADSWPDAIDALQSASRLAPDEGRFAIRLSQLWAALGDEKKAAEFTARAAALGIMGQATDTIVDASMMTRQLFNQYAVGFEKHLGELHYAVPADIEHMLISYIPFIAGRTVIDLGCGTGLMGKRLRSVAGRMVGIDVSPGMLEQAAAKNIYDELRQADVVGYLHASSEIAALIVAADVLVYIGDLSPLFEAVVLHLEDNGLFVITVERTPIGDFLQSPTQRYAHSEHYLRRLAGQAGLNVLVCEEQTPRWDEGKPIDGLMLLLQKPIETQRSS